MRVLALAEDPGSVPRQVALVSAVQVVNLQRLIESESRPGVGWKCVRYDDRAILCDGEEAGVERGIEMRREQQAVEDVEARGVRAAIDPRLDVARTQELGHVQTGDRATAVPVLQQATVEDVLADSLDHQTVSFRRPGEAARREAFGRAGTRGATGGGGRRCR